MNDNRYLFLGISSIPYQILEMSYKRAHQREMNCLSFLLLYLILLYFTYPSGK